ncbi:MAG: hypothetical protein GX774_08705 [Armatimonadetes bacterium]|nr:hypothetical protein [Armatimonadota bacterium]
MAEVERGIESILAFPRAFPEVDQDVRRYLTHRFPFAILYTTETDGSLFIVAVMHLKRRPAYWHARLADR